ncbi:hypothetical protein AQUCO_05300084v1 [Aquilegia coerulea]|uniref:Uncharacterized protein n=1 Tax=Aquilegia coerulea TaxID=218851 RepID=A0A2G5CIA4_AQUCA|nr:hypothetical protein AQUCO_05300084v1 [Aquilegia coerulea]
MLFKNALQLNESELHGRQLKVSAKRTNVPGLKQFRGRRPNPDEGEMDADVEMSSRAEDGDEEDPNSKENLEEMKKKKKEIGEEAGALREMQAKVEKEMGDVQGIVIACTFLNFYNTQTSVVQWHIQPARL